MSRSQIFFAPGHWLVEFFLSLFNFGPTDLDNGTYWVLSFIGSAYFWAVVIRIVIAFTKKAFGFHHPGQK